MSRFKKTPRLELWRAEAGGWALRRGLEGLAHVASFHPHARPRRHGVERVRDLRYGPDGAHRLDLWRPAEPGPHPAVLYIHGGGFHILSKETHWLMGLMLARAGYAVFMIDYRLSPRHRFPAALQDVARAWLWVHEHAARHSGDASQVVVAGESAGANLAMSLTLMACAPGWSAPREEAEAVYALGQVPSAVIAACGLFQVTRPERLWESKRRYPAWLKDRLIEIALGYVDRDAPPGELIDPLCAIEALTKMPERALPPCFLPIGTRDPLLDDTRRLRAELERLGAESVIEIYPGEVHAFHALIWREQARRCWRDTLEFLDRHVRGSRRGG